MFVKVWADEPHAEVLADGSVGLGVRLHNMDAVWGRLLRSQPDADRYLADVIADGVWLRVRNATADDVLNWLDVAMGKTNQARLALEKEKEQAQAAADAWRAANKLKSA